jgi:hypothetical protein
VSNINLRTTGEVVSPPKVTEHPTQHENWVDKDCDLELIRRKLLIKQKDSPMFVEESSQSVPGGCKRDTQDRTTSWTAQGNRWTSSEKLLPASANSLGTFMRRSIAESEKLVGQQT